MEIKVGDTVEIIKSELIYSTFGKMFEKVGFKNTKQNCLGKSLIGIVFSIDKHFSNGEMLCSLNMKDGKQILIQLKGVKKIKEGTMKNLLETEFVIENCTLSQRLAIKAYCDEKKIKYASRYTFENTVFDALVWNKTEFLNCESGRRDERDRVTFSELIQFLDEYQPEHEFKVGDAVVFTGKNGGIVTEYWTVGKVGIISSIMSNHFVFENKDNFNCFSTGSGSNARESFRLATPEEIKKWKEENEIKLPKINQYDGKVNGEFIVYGNNCANLKISWFKNIGDLSSFVNIGENRTVISIKLNSDVEITMSHIEQIKKFIEHNKL